MVWECTRGASGRLSEMAAALGGAHKFVLATDPDREGEAISWHAMQELQVRLPQQPVTPRRSETHYPRLEPMRQQSFWWLPSCTKHATSC